MAKKRMFRLDVLETDAFMDMPLTTQALYFHLNLRADDDGFVANPKMITRNIGASMDDLNLLIAKRFVLLFEDGVIVIKHWRLHNNLTTNRYQETKFIEDKSFLLIKDNGAYSLDHGEPIDDTHYIEVGKRETRQRRATVSSKTAKDKIRIDKNRLDKNSIDKTPTVYYPNDELLNSTFSDYVKMRKAIKAPMTDRAITLAMNKLEELSGGDTALAVEIINQSILNSWKGLFPLKQERQQTKSSIDWSNI